MAIILAVAFCLASGYLFVLLAFPGPATTVSERWINFFLAPGFGIGIFSIVFLLARLFAITHLLVSDALVTAMLAVIYLTHRDRNARSRETETRVPDLDLPEGFQHVLSASFAISTLAAIYASILRARVHSHGDGWDAFAIWNLHARFLFLGGTHWRDGFSPLIPWSHPDYPLLIPAAIAHFWTCLGNDSAAVPAIIGLLFTFSTLGLLVSSLTRLRGRIAGMLAGLALASTPFFVEQGSSQYADVPLSFFFLACTALVHLHGDRVPETSSTLEFSSLMLASFAAGFSAWTKNEGLLFLLAFVGSQIAVRWRGTSDQPQSHTTARCEVLSLLAAVAPAILLLAWFKHFIAPAGDLLSSPEAMIYKILSPSRYWIIVQWYVREFFRFGHWVVPTTVLLILLWLLMSGAGNRQRAFALRSSVLTLVLTLAGYFAVYVITPHDLYWHLRFSLSRLFLQLWPTVLFLFFLGVGRQTDAHGFRNEANSQKSHTSVKKLGTPLLT